MPKREKKVAPSPVRLVCDVAHWQVLSLKLLVN